MLTNPVIMVQQLKSENLPPLSALQRFTDPSHCDMGQRISIENQYWPMFEMLLITACDLLLNKTGPVNGVCGH